MVEPARVCAISCVVEGKLTVISARVIYRLGALCDSRGPHSSLAPAGTIAYAVVAWVIGRGAEPVYCHLP